jgi:hypothetical protein
MIYGNLEQMIIDEMVDMGLDPKKKEDVSKYWEAKLPEVEGKEDVRGNLH